MWQVRRKWGSLSWGSFLGNIMLCYCLHVQKVNQSFFWLRNRQNLTMILYYSEILLSKTKAANFALSFFFQGGCHQRSVYWLLFNGGVQKVSSIELKSIWGCSLLLLHCRESEHPMILVCTYIVIKLCVSKVQRHMHFSGVIYGSIY